MLTESRQRIGRVRGSSALTGQAIAGDGDDDDDYDENVCSHIFSLTIDPSNTYYRRYSFTLLFLGCLENLLAQPHHALDWHEHDVVDQEHGGAHRSAGAIKGRGSRL